LEVNNLPSAQVLEQKKARVAELTERLKKSCTGVLVDYKGINVADDVKLRKELREAGVNYEVVKNTLLKLAVEEAGLSGLHSVLEGTTALAVSETDYVAAARILVKYTDVNKNFTIKAGFVDGGVINGTSVLELSKLPSRGELVAKALGGLNAPIVGFVSVLNANLRSLVVALSAIAEKKAG
jgi:large subunit ribosomal protein L10